MPDSSENSTSKVLKRLDTLCKKLKDDGRYVGANTCALAIEEIERLSAYEPAAGTNEDDPITGASSK